jgi:hypothetical protein
MTKILCLIIAFFEAIFGGKDTSNDDDYEWHVEDL